MSTFPARRPRRLRTTPAMRNLVAETQVRPSDLILPMFIAVSYTHLTLPTKRIV